MPIINQFKTAILLGALTALLLWIGSFWGGQGLTVAIIFSILMNFVSFFWSHKLVLMMYHAKEVKDQGARLYKIVKEVSQEAHLPMPKVYTLPTPHANAFATGPSYKKAAVACTEGILRLLNDDELKGVVAHEVAHIKNRDTLIQTAAATIAGVISYIAMMARFAAIFGGGSRDRNGGNGIELLVLAILTPLIATLIQLAISRSREYIADATGAKIAGSGKGLASALEKISADINHHPLMPAATTETTAHLFIANPFRGHGLVNLFMTHPPMQERVKRLKQLRL